VRQERKDLVVVTVSWVMSKPVSLQVVDHFDRSLRVL